MRSSKPIGFALIGAVVAAWYLHSRPDEASVSAAHPAAVAAPPSAPDRSEPSVARAAPAEVVPAVALSPTKREPAAPLDESSIMSTLRELGDSAPERSLQLAREGNERFPNSPDAAERGWYVCKSLVNLEDFYDAREEARAMVAKYPGTAWATDVQRHLLVNPLDLPGDPAPSEQAP